MIKYKIDSRIMEGMNFQAYYSDTHLVLQGENGTMSLVTIFILPVISIFKIIHNFTFDEKCCYIKNIEMTLNF